MLRNVDWNYIAFTTAKQHRPGVNQAECLACHKPLDKVSYTFTLDLIAAAARKKSLCTQRKTLAPARLVARKCSERRAQLRVCWSRWDLVLLRCSNQRPNLGRHPESI